ncbi:YifB family Mg chelatase-like AAA ATPase [Candidatus Peregrinibacteria bacterium]|nr:YifB family Mg chelatase-like AAA ATPase [Candidatus Peregrinibacteria bacterium]
MHTKVHSMSLRGLDSIPIEVEADILRGQTKFFVVGLGDIAVQEARERVRSAVKNSGFKFPFTRVIVNLAPADVRKIGPSFDLPIALGILLAFDQIEIDPDILQKSVIIGELSLDGGLRSVNGILPITTEAKKLGFESVFLPKVNAKEAALVEGIQIYGIETLQELILHFSGVNPLSAFPPTDAEKLYLPEEILEDFSYIRGQEHAKRALEIAAAGGHNILMNGTPGSGKTLMARALRSILPKMTKEEALEVTKIHSIANLLKPDVPLITTRPFRTVHHTASSISLVGGGKNPRPGEISLAHRGVLFMDELAEFPGQVLEVLRQPLEDRRITISRASGTASFPAHFLLVAAMNPTPSGYDPNSDGKSFNIDQKYRKKLSGPFLDRIDLYADVAPVQFEKLREKHDAEPSRIIAERVQKARDSQSKRFQGAGIFCNAEMKIKEIKAFCEISEASEDLLKMAMKQFGLSARGFHRILKVARTIADLSHETDISENHVAEALQYRPKFQE